MAGNSKRRGAIRKDGTKKGMVVGSGGQPRRALKGKGPTPPGEMRPGHPKARAAARRAAQDQQQQKHPEKHSHPTILMPYRRIGKLVVFTGRTPRPRLPETRADAAIGMAFTSGEWPR